MIKGLGNFYISKKSVWELIFNDGKIDLDIERQTTIN